MPARTSHRGALLSVVMGLLLLLGGLVAGENGGGAPGPTVETPEAFSVRAAGALMAPVNVALSGALMAGRPAAGRTVTVPAHRPGSLAASGTAQLSERIGSLDDRTSAGTGDHLDVRRAVGDLWPPATEATPLQRVSAAAVGAPRAPLPARAPPAS